MKVRYKISFSPEKRKDRGKLIKKDVPVIMTVTFDGKRFRTTTGLKCDLVQWDIKNERYQSSVTGSLEKNAILKSIRDEMEEIYLVAKNQKINITPEYIKEKYRLKHEKNFLEYFDEFVMTEGRNNAWSLSTYKKFSTLKTHLQNFNKEKHVTLEFGNVNHDFYQKLFNYFVELGHINSTIKKNVKNLNWFLRWCIDKKKQTVADFNSFEVKDVTDKGKTRGYINMVFLKPDEFLLMYEAEINDLRLSKVRDMFCFMCATGLRISDYIALKPEDIENNSISFTTQKTVDPIEVPLNEFSRAILKKYNNHLPKISNVKFNLYLKELAMLLCLDRKITRVYTKAGQVVRDIQPLYEVITTHAARRTFVSLSVFLNINTEILMRFTGHKEHAMLKRYLGIDPRQEVEEMAKFSAETIKLKII